MTPPTGTLKIGVDASDAKRGKVGHTSDPTRGVISDDGIAGSSGLPQIFWIAPTRGVIPNSENCKKELRRVN